MILCVSWAVFLIGQLDQFLCAPKHLLLATCPLEVEQYRMTSLKCLVVGRLFARAKRVTGSQGSHNPQGYPRLVFASACVRGLKSKNITRAEITRLPEVLAQNPHGITLQHSTGQSSSNKDLPLTGEVEKCWGQFCHISYDWKVKVKTKLNNNMRKQGSSSIKNCLYTLNSYHYRSKGKNL